MIHGMGCREVSLFLENSVGNVADYFKALLNIFGFISYGSKHN